MRRLGRKEARVHSMTEEQFPVQIEDRLDESTVVADTLFLPCYS
jgi:hypothetical protein